MTSALFGIDASLLLGAGACIAAAGAAGRAASRSPAGTRPTWRGVAIAQGLFGLEMMVGLRYRGHAAAELLLRAHDGYATRQPLQTALIAAVALLLAVVATLALRRARGDGPLAAAVVASAVTAALLLLETVSLHAVDALMYRPAGPVVALAWGWATASAVVAVSAVTALRRKAA